VVEAGSTVQQLVFEQLLRTGQQRLVVVRDGRPLGLIDVALISSVQRGRWPATLVEQVMRPISLSVAPDGDVAELLDRLDAATTTVPVVADDRLLGVVDLNQVLRYVQLRDQLQVPLTRAGSATV